MSNAPSEASPIICDLPFFAWEHKPVVIQGFHGPYGHSKESHTPHRDLSYAVDFALPLESPIYAVRGGVVRSVNAVEKSFCNDPKAPVAIRSMYVPNFVVVEHSDGYFALYANLAYGGVNVVQNQRIQIGQLLGYTGKSGWIGDIPHVHFQVHTNESLNPEGKGRYIKTHPIAFHQIDGSLEHSHLQENNFSLAADMDVPY